MLQISGFYVTPDPPKTLVRFAFCKTDTKLLDAVARLEAYLKRP
jgi:hypothetical protein